MFIIITKALFNAFGVGYAVKMLKESGAEFIGSIQLNMPNNIRDIFIMEIALTKNYKKVIDKADREIIRFANKFKANKPIKSGLNAFNYITGFILKVLRFYPKTDKYISAPKINKEKCAGCGKCAKLCPLQNIKIVGGKALSNGKCTVCYRCFNNCGAKALTILGDKVYGRYSFETAYSANESRESR